MQQKQPALASGGHSDLGLCGVLVIQHWMEGACEVRDGFSMTSEQNTYNTIVRHFSL